MSSFDGGAPDKAYLQGFSRGDLNVARVSDVSLFVSTTTTHPAFAELFSELFSPFGHVYNYLIGDELGRFKWKVAVRLERSFDFLMRSENIDYARTLSTPQLRLA